MQAFGEETLSRYFTATGKHTTGLGVHRMRDSEVDVKI